KLLTRHPSEQEHDILKLAYDEQLKYFKTAPEKANAYRSVGEKPADESLDPAQASAMTAIAQAIINHDEFQVKQ
ncbi:MAG: hypothetical protein VCB26_11005, partial [Candidatus Hydrogenedentota bacterium]